MDLGQREGEGEREKEREGGVGGRRETGLKEGDRTEGGRRD